MSKHSPFPHSFLLLTGTFAIVAGLTVAAVPGVAASAPQGQTLPPPPMGDLTTRGAIHTVVLDPGHGGEEDGAHGVNGTKEKDLVLKFAQQLKAEIENKLQLKVILTRDSDDTLPVDQRAVVANTQKGDLFISLHANASVRKELRGTEVVTLDPDDYVTPAPPQPPAGPKGKQAPQPAPAAPAQIPVVGGGVRTIEPVLWDFAQLPHLERSQMLKQTLIKRLQEPQIPGDNPLGTAAPLRVLAGVNMPAILVELGFLTNPDDEAALTTGKEMPAAIIDAIVNTIGDVRYGFPAAPGKTVVR